MKMNIGSNDAIIRWTVGIILLLILFLDHTAIRWVGLIGIPLIITAFFRFCPLYGLLKIKTNRK